MSRVGQDNFVQELAGKLRLIEARRRPLRVREIVSINLSTPFTYRALPSLYRCKIDARGILIPEGRDKLLGKLLDKLSDDEIENLKVAAIDNFLLIYLSQGKMPSVEGGILLREIVDKEEIILLPIELGFMPRLNDGEIKECLSFKSPFKLLLMQAGRLDCWGISIDSFKPLTELISNNFVEITLKPVAISHNEEYGARLTQIVPPSLPQMQSVISIPTHSAVDSGVGGVGGVGNAAANTISQTVKQSFWQRLRAFPNNLVRNIKSLFSEREDLSKMIDQAVQNVKINVDQQTYYQRPGILARLKNWLGGGQQSKDQHQTISHDSADINRRRIKLRSPQPPSSLEQQWQRLKAKVTFAALRNMKGLTRYIFRHQTEHLIKMLELFEKGDIEQAFRHAIPLAEQEQEKQSEPNINLSTPKPRRDLDFRLLELFNKSGASPSLMAVGSSSYEMLKQHYENGAKLLLEQKNYRAAAFVYAHLLRDYYRAAQALSQGGFHREAAVLYLEKLHSPAAASQELAMVGDFETAAKIAISAHHYQKAVQYLRMLGDDRQVKECYQLWIDYLIEKGRLVEAIKIIESELNDWRRAADLLIDEYKKSSTHVRIQHIFHAIRLLTREETMIEADEWLGRIRGEMQDESLMGTIHSGTYYASMLTYGESLCQLEKHRLAVGFASADLMREAWRSLIVATLGFHRFKLQRQVHVALESLTNIANTMADPLLKIDLERATKLLQSNRDEERAKVEANQHLSTQFLKGGKVSITSFLSTHHDLFLIGRGDGKVECRSPQFATDRIRPLGEGLLGNLPQKLRPLQAGTIVGECRYSATAIAVNSTSTIIALLGVDGVVTVWSSNGVLINELRDPASPYTALCSVIVDDCLFLGNAKGQVFVIYYYDGKKLAESSKEGIIFSIAYDRENRLLACAGRSESIQLFSTAEDKLLNYLRAIPSEFGIVRTLQFRNGSNKRPTLAFGGERGGLSMVRMYNATGMGAMDRSRFEGHSHWVNCLTFTDQGELISAGFDRKIYLWNNRTNKAETLIGHHNEVIGLAVSAEGKLYSIDMGGVVACWDIEKRELIYTFELS